MPPAATIGYMTALAGRPGTRVLAWSLAGLAPLVMAGALVLLVFNARVMSPTRIAIYGFAVVAVVVYAGIGGLIAARIPRNPIGWLLCLIGLALAVSLFLEQYGLRGLATAPGSLPAVRQITALGYGTQNLAITPLIIVLLLFPDGRLPSRRWRPVLWCAIAATAGAGFAQLLQRGTVVAGSLTNALVAAHVSYPNPLGIFPRHGWYGALLAVAGAITVASAVLAVVSVFVRRRGAPAELRQQLAWLAYVGVLTFGFVVVNVGYGLATHGGDTFLGTILFVFVFGMPIFGIPVACAVAVLRYHLYDLDVVVKKTVVAALVAATFTAVYVLVVVAVGAATGRPGGNPLTFVAAALAAVLLQPVRTRAGLLADRLVYGRRATPYEVLSEFSEQIAGTYSTEDVLPQMARMLVEATGAQRAEVWLRAAGAERLEAAWPERAGPQAMGPEVPASPERPADQEPVGQEGSASPEGRASQERPVGPAAAHGVSAEAAGNGRARAFDVEHQGERLGALRITSSPREPLTPAGERLVRDVAAQAGLVLRNVALIEDLRASRQRLVAAADEARRRLERNLHDGAQQQLVALRITLQLARQLMADSPGEAAELLAQTEQEAQDALEELRDLARGIYPPLLADLGLPAALDAQARKAPLPVTVQADGVSRYPQDVEAAVYFCVLEALQNVTKYAQASAACVTLGHDDSGLAFTVSDDGRGFDPAAAPAGTGVQGMADRLAALGGTLHVSSAPGHGTQVTGRVPAALNLSVPGGTPATLGLFLAGAGPGTPAARYRPLGGSQSLNPTSPNVTRSPARTRKPEPTRHPLAQVPLVDPRSASTQSSPAWRSSAWRHDTVMSVSCRSELAARPIVNTVPPQPRGSTRRGSRTVHHAARRSPVNPSHTAAARSGSRARRRAGRRSLSRLASWPAYRACSASSSRCTKVSCDRRPSADPSLSTLIAASRSASDIRSAGRCGSKAAMPQTIALASSVHPGL
jgi:signal transduction histidine kinase